MVQPYAPTETLRNTRIRKAVLSLFTEQQSPLGVPEVVVLLEQRGTRVNRTSIYRELATLERAGVVSAVQMSDGLTRYELANKEHHHHLICIQCGRIEDVALEHDLAQEQALISRRTQFKILKHRLEFLGMCRSCQQKKLQKHP